MLDLVLCPSVCWSACLCTESFSVFIAARKRSFGKVMFLHLCVILFTGGGVSVEDLWWGGLGAVASEGVSVMETRPLVR